MSDKLPEWPENPSTPGEYPADEWHNYWIDTTAAALARMEALVELVNDMHGGNGRSKGGKNWYERRDELLTACERRNT